METEVVSSLTAYGPGYICEELKDKEQVVGLQTDKPLKRAFMPFGGIKMAEEACKTYGYEPNPKFHKIFTDYHKTHNQAVFDAYTPENEKTHVTQKSLPVFRILTEEDVSSAITAVLPSTESIF